MLTLICGIPNAGKTTFSAKYGNVIHLDDFSGLVAQCNRTAAKVVGDVCVEGVYGTAESRRCLLQACQHQTPKICIWLDTDVDTCRDREKHYRKRTTTLVTIHHKRFEPPTLDEGWDEIIRIGE